MSKCFSTLIPRLILLEDLTGIQKRISGAGKSAGKKRKIRGRMCVCEREGKGGREGEKEKYRIKGGRNEGREEGRRGD